MAAQHSQTLESWFVHAPGLVVVMPSTPYDAKGLLKSRDPRRQPRRLPREAPALRRRGRCRRRSTRFRSASPTSSGRAPDVTVVAVRGGRAPRAPGRPAVAREGVELEVVDVRTLKPLDLDTIAASRRGRPDGSWSSPRPRAPAASRARSSRACRRGLRRARAPPVRVDGEGHADARSRRRSSARCCRRSRTSSRRSTRSSARVQAADGDRHDPSPGRRPAAHERRALVAVGDQVLRPDRRR